MCLLVGQGVKRWGDGDPSMEIWLGVNMKMSLNCWKPLEINLRSS
jgi:hypothetical protein